MASELGSASSLSAAARTNSPRPIGLMDRLRGVAELQEKISDQLDVLRRRLDGDAPSKDDASNFSPPPGIDSLTSLMEERSRDLVQRLAALTDRF